MPCAITFTCVAVYMSQIWVGVFPLCVSRAADALVLSDLVTLYVKCSANAACDAP